MQEMYDLQSTWQTKTTFERVSSNAKSDSKIMYEDNLHKSCQSLASCRRLWTSKQYTAHKCTHPSKSLSKGVIFWKLLQRTNPMMYFLIPWQNVITYHSPPPPCFSVLPRMSWLHLHRLSVY